MLALGSPTGLSGRARKRPVSSHYCRDLGSGMGGPGLTPSRQLSCGRSHRASTQLCLLLKP